MMMREAHHVNYNNITECKLYDKKVGMCVIDNFLGVYSQHIKKLTREKFIAECEFFYKEKQSEQRDNNDCPILEDDTGESDDKDDDIAISWKN